MIGRMILLTASWFVWMGVLLFGSAGTLAWFAAWLWLIEWAACGIWIGMWLLRFDPGLLAERLTLFAPRGQSQWDRVFMMAVTVLWCLWLCLMGFDSVRFDWSHVSIGYRVLGAVGVFLGIFFIRSVFAANRFASPVVAIQHERGHTLIDTGPYAHVRHPMYAYAILFLVGTPLMLGSWWGLACVPFMVAGIGWRAVNEERTLVEGLPGYREYLQRVRYRFVPGIW